EREPDLAALGRHEILEQQRDEAGRQRWRFRHVLMRDAAYGLLTAEDRTASHAAAARFLEADGEDPAVVASHCGPAGGEPGAVRRLRDAAALAHRRFDHAAVLQLVGRGIAAGASGAARGALRSIEAQTLLWQGEFEASWAASVEAGDLLPAEHPNRIQSLAVRTVSGMQLGKTVTVDRHVEELLAARPGRAERAEYTDALGWTAVAFAAVAQRADTARILGRI